jgi:hypothetical protein
MLGKRRRSRPAAADCLDAETLAAYAEGGLSDQQRAEAEGHMTGCARCQMVMAAIVKSAGDVERAPVSVPGRSWWPLDLRWLMPLAGAAAAALLWMVVPAGGPERQSAQLEDRARPDGSKPSQSAARVAESAEPSPLVVAPAPSLSAVPRAVEEKAAKPESFSPLAVREQQLERQLAEQAERKNLAVRRGEADQLAKKEERAAPEAGVTPATPPARQESVVVAEANRPAAAATAPAPPPQALGTTADTRRSSSAAGARTDLRSLDPAVRWRLAEPGIVERSRNEGATWERLDTGVRTLLRAGDCPSASTCWVVGDAGVVLLTTDAQQWRQVTPPSPEDLVAVDAADAGAAVVRAANGRSFRTTDGGTRWTSVP